MEPLQQWVCDVCGEVIEKPEDGYVVWSRDIDGKLDRIRIVHKNRIVGDERVGCDRDRSFLLSMALPSFLGAKGIVMLLSLVDPGPNFTREYEDRIANKRLFLEIVRRLQIPYYEEARLYWNKAMADGFFDGANELWAYDPENLQALVEKYGGGNEVED